MKIIVKFLGVLSVVFLARLLPFNFIIGSEYVMFSWSTIFAPVVAVQCGFSWVLSFLCSKSILTTSSLMLFLAHRMPLLFAARVFSKRDKVISLFVPMICIALFVIHPVGSQAWLYAMYWLIPIGLNFAKCSEWSRALTASFVAHAVGSVVWLYTSMITADLWMALIPIVACERLLMSGTMIFVNKLCTYCVSLLQKNIVYFTNSKAV